MVKRDGQDFVWLEEHFFGGRLYAPTGSFACAGPDVARAGGGRLDDDADAIDVVAGAAVDVVEEIGELDVKLGGCIDGAARAEFETCGGVVVEAEIFDGEVEFVGTTIVEEGLGALNLDFDGELGVGGELLFDEAGDDAGNAAGFRSWLGQDVEQFDALTSGDCGSIGETHLVVTHEDAAGAAAGAEFDLNVAQGQDEAGFG
ncbi:MAG TPA: hypothetical protein PK156_16930, partial [Polyangium sp.]|nr:hypothetical protein [Polyangium sp.]